MKILACCIVLVVILAVGNVRSHVLGLSQSAPTPQTGTLSGLILDHGQARIPAAKILVEGKGLRRTLTSGDDGSYTIELPDGKYRVSVARNGFYPSSKKTVRIRSNAAVTTNITLRGIRNDASHP
jgi:hypothetical protein